MSPVENAGIVLRNDDDYILGSCFLFRNVQTVVTAAHCVDGLIATQLSVVFPCSRASARFAVRNVVQHPHADVAVIIIEPVPERDVTWPVFLLFDERAFGLEFATVGYPRLPFENHVSPRYFRGYVQRFFNYSSGRYSYVAAELSILCPVGLSGASLQHTELFGRLYGLVTENVEVATEKDAFEEIDEGGAVLKESRHKIITYGVAVWLPVLEPWLDHHVPRLTSDEEARWGENQRRWFTEEKIQSAR